MAKPKRLEEEVAKEQPKQLEAVAAVEALVVTEAKGLAIQAVAVVAAAADSSAKEMAGFVAMADSNKTVPVNAEVVNIIGKGKTITLIVPLGVELVVSGVAAEDTETVPIRLPTTLISNMSYNSAIVKNL